jgi:WxL domain surface cell wall-binding
MYRRVAGVHQKRTHRSVEDGTPSDPKEPTMRSNPRRLVRLAGAAGVAASVVIGAAPAGAISGTATISAGALAFVSSPSSVGFSATLNGQDQTVTSAQTFDIGDATGSGVGWNVTATSTTFTTGGGSPRTLSTSATTVQSTPTVACDTGVTCTTATTNVSFPYTLPAASTAPTATKLFNAAADTGMGNQTVSATFRLSLPANTYAGSYSSTWTYSLVSAP